MGLGLAPEAALVVEPGVPVLVSAPNSVVTPLAQVVLRLVHESPVSLVECVHEPGGHRVEEELIVPDARRLVLLLEDLVVVDAQLKVSRAVSITN